nr:MAG TPA: hypothetical protein [Caudoviricetes sp.]
MIKIFIVFSIALTIIIIIVSVVWWAFSLCNDAVWLSFSSFRKYYDTAPEKYELSYYEIAYHITRAYRWQAINMKTPIDYVRYWLWLRKKNRHKKTTDNINRTQEYINCVRKDLEKFTRE